MTIQAIQIPQPGQRVGVVYGPGEFAADNAGVVITTVSTQWGDYAVVMMDDGTTKRCDGMNRGPGIGWHYIK